MVLPISVALPWNDCAPVVVMVPLVAMPPRLVRLLMPLMVVEPPSSVALPVKLRVRSLPSPSMPPVKLALPPVSVRLVLSTNSIVVGLVARGGDVGLCNSRATVISGECCEVRNRATENCVQWRVDGEPRGLWDTRSVKGSISINLGYKKRT